MSFPGVWVWADEMPPRIVHHPSDVVVKVGNPATLSCRVDGKPKPTVEWLHNGQPLETGKGDRHLQPIVLSEGSLFFLNVGSGKRGPSHEGFYACIARNSAGIAISRNASLYIAGEMESYSCTLIGDIFITGIQKKCFLSETFSSKTFNLNLFHTLLCHPLHKHDC